MKEDTKQTGESRKEGEAENKMGFNKNMPFFVLNSWPTLFSVTYFTVFTHTATYYSQCTLACLLIASSVLNHTRAFSLKVCTSLAKLPAQKVSNYQPGTCRATAELSTGIYDILQHLG